MTRWDLINYFIQKYKYQSYLEIGILKGLNFKKIEVPVKVGVDPCIPRNFNSPGAFNAAGVSLTKIFRMTSDEYFANYKEKFELIFIDGLHHRKQVKKDIINSLSVLEDNGTIICHDMNPRRKALQVSPRRTKRGYWLGDCWKAWVDLRRERSDLEMVILKVETGCGIIRRGSQPLLTDKLKLNWKNLCKMRAKWLPTIHPNEYFT
jgi:hypothetical protein